MSSRRAHETSQLAVITVTAPLVCGAGLSLANWLLAKSLSAFDTELALPRFALFVALLLQLLVLLPYGVVPLWRERRAAAFPALGAAVVATIVTSLWVGPVVRWLLQRTDS